MLLLERSGLISPIFCFSCKTISLLLYDGGPRRSPGDMHGFFVDRKSYRLGWATSQTPTEPTASGVMISAPNSSAYNNNSQTGTVTEHYAVGRWCWDPENTPKDCSLQTGSKTGSVVAQTKDEASVLSYLLRNNNSSSSVTNNLHKQVSRPLFRS